MLHLPSMLIYGFLSFSMAFLNKALFEVADFRNSLFVIFIQLLFILLSFQILGYTRLMPVPVMTQNDIYLFLVPSILFSLSTILSLQALMKLNVAIYVVIKVSIRKYIFNWARNIQNEKFNYCLIRDIPRPRDFGRGNSLNRFLKS